MKRCFLVLAAVVAASTFGGRVASAQAYPGAHRGGVLQVGVAFSNAQSDYTPKRISGATAYATFDLTEHLGVEADVHLLQFGTPNDFAERTYMAGLRYVYRKRRYELYGKGLAGLGQAVAQQPYQVNGYVPSSNFAAALGGGLDIRVPKNFTVRAVDFEYQDWPNFASNYGGNGLSPTVLSFGVAYRIR